jgi:hypothetical protein
MGDGSFTDLSGSSAYAYGYDVVSTTYGIYAIGCQKEGSSYRASWWLDDYSTVTRYAFGPLSVASDGNGIAVESGTVYCAGSYTAGSAKLAALWTGTDANMTRTVLPKPSTATASEALDIARAGGAEA